MSRDTTSFTRDTTALVAALKVASLAVSDGQKAVALVGSAIDTVDASNVLREITFQIDRVVGSRQAFATHVDRQRSSLQRQLRQPRERAVSAFATKASTQMTSTERSVYFEDLLNWARRITLAINDQIDALGRVVAAADENAIGWAGDITSQINSDVRRLNAFAGDSAALRTWPIGSGAEEVALVLISGFSATLVIFLGVNGGLAVLTEKGSSPDSYVLFFACFVGAVYSQDVWAWARGRLRGSLGETEQPPESAGSRSTESNTANVGAATTMETA
jgi:hypothetical protein